MVQCCDEVELIVDVRQKYKGVLQQIDFNSITIQDDIPHSKSKSKKGALKRIRSKSRRLDQTVALPKSQEDPSLLKARSDIPHFSHNDSLLENEHKETCIDSTSTISSEQISNNWRGSFELDDFDPAMWFEADSNQNISNVGFATIMAATVIIHPMVFVTGAATAVWAVGLFHAVEKGYELFSDGSFSNLFWKDTSPVSKEKSQNEVVDVVEEQSKRTKKAKTFVNETCDVHLRSKCAEKVESETKSYDHQITKPELSPCIQQSSAQQQDYGNNLDEALKQYFPPLQHNILVELEFAGLNADEFFEVFFSDDAPYSLKHFQEMRGDIDIVFGNWKRCGEIDMNPLSFHHRAMKREQLVPFPNCVYEERTLSFRTLTKSFFGPAYATTKKVQRRVRVSTNFLIIENKIELLDVPFCERFFVLERWIVETETRNLDTSVTEDGHRVSTKKITKLNVDVELFMRESCTWEKQIRSKSLIALKESLSAWGAKATQALDLTSKKKSNRLQQKKITSREKSQHIPVSRSVTSSSENDSEALMKIHKAQLEKIKNKISTSETEWSDIEIIHSLNAGRGSAFAEVLDQNELPLKILHGRNDQNDSTFAKVLDQNKLPQGMSNQKRYADDTILKTNNKSKKSMLRLLKRRNK